MSERVVDKLTHYCCHSTQYSQYSPVVRTVFIYSLYVAIDIIASGLLQWSVSVCLSERVSE